MARIGAHHLINTVVDDDSFRSWDAPPVHPRLGTDYESKLERAQANSGVDESILTGEAMLAGQRVGVIVGEFAFLAGSIGRASSERIARAFERAATERLALFASPISGGTRVQEGTRAFLQLVKISQAVSAYRRSGLPLLVYLRDPTTGGPLVSWGSLGHVTFAEPGALIGMLGPRVAQTLTGQQLPEGVQRAEKLARLGIVDGVVEADDLREQIAKVLRIVAPPHAVTSGAASPPSPAAPTPKGADSRAWASVEATDQPGRPRMHDIVDHEALFYLPLMGTGGQKYHGPIAVGLARFEGFAGVLVGHNRRALPGEVVTFDALQMAQRGFRIAEELQLPLVTVVDTPGVEISVAAEQRGLAREIARTVEALVDVDTPAVSVILGAGTGVSALTLLPGDRTICAEKAWLAPLPLDGASEILYRSTEHAPQLAEEQGITATDLVEAGAVDAIVEEGPGAAANPQAFTRKLVETVASQLGDIAEVSSEERQRARRERYRRMY